MVEENEEEYEVVEFTKTDSFWYKDAILDVDEYNP
jgi:hypothetical protein